MDGIRHLLRDEKGVTSIEYALIAGVMCTGIVGAVTLIVTTLSGFFNLVAAGF